MTRPIVADQALHTELAKGSAGEEKAAEQLRQLVSKYDLEKWIFTRKILIDSSSIPHSHPVLTLNTKYIGSDNLALSTFLHEQFHWLLELEQEKTTAAMEELRQTFPDAPTEPALGAKGGILSVPALNRQLHGISRPQRASRN